jgi:parallel beta-helix repeat protein
VDRMNRRLLVVLLVLVVISSAAGAYFILAARRPETSAKYPVAEHSPIMISADTDFTKPGAGSGCECVRSGSGNEFDPYVISDWVVNSTGSDGIVIWGTSAHVLIARVEIRGASADRGIYMSQVENGVVQDCRITRWFFGVYVFRSSNLEFTNNTVTGNSYGIQLEASQHNNLIGNRFDDNSELGIFLRGSNNILKDNSVTRNGFGGINVDGTAGPANDNQLEGNAVSENSVYGIGVWRAANNVFRSNTVTHNQVVGIMLTDHCTNNLIEANTVSNNQGSGIITIAGSSGNTIRHNTARGNGDGVNDFDLYDMASGNVWQDNTYDTKKPDSID